MCHDPNGRAKLFAGVCVNMITNGTGEKSFACTSSRSKQASPLRKAGNHEMHVSCFTLGLANGDDAVAAGPTI